MYSIQTVFLNKIGQIELPISTNEGSIIILFENGELLKVKDERNEKNNMLREYLEDAVIQELMENLKKFSKDLEFIIRLGTYPDVWIKEKSHDRISNTRVLTFKFEHSYLPFTYYEKNHSIFCKMYDIEIQVDKAMHESKKEKLLLNLELAQRKEEIW